MAGSACASFTKHSSTLYADWAGVWRWEASLSPFRVIHSAWSLFVTLYLARRLEQLWTLLASRCVQMKTNQTFALHCSHKLDDWTACAGSVYSPRTASVGLYSSACIWSLNWPGPPVLSAFSSQSLITPRDRCQHLASVGTFSSRMDVSTLQFSPPWAKSHLIALTPSIRFVCNHATFKNKKVSFSEVWKNMNKVSGYISTESKRIKLWNVTFTFLLTTTTIFDLA